MISEGATGIKWKGFVHSLLSVTESKASTIEHANRGEFVDGKIVGKPSLVKGASCASLLRSLALFSAKSTFTIEGKGKALVRDKGC